MIYCHRLQANLEIVCLGDERQAAWGAYYLKQTLGMAVLGPLTSILIGEDYFDPLEESASML